MIKHIYIFDKVIGDIGYGETNYHLIVSRYQQLYLQGYLTYAKEKYERTY